MTPQELKNSILQLAIQGKLVEQRPEEGTAAELLGKILAAKATKVGSRVPRDRNGRAVAPRPPIPDDEKPFDIPESWEWVRIGDVFNLQAGKNIKSEDIYQEYSPEHKYKCYGGNGCRGYVADYNRSGHHVLIGRQGALCGNINYAEGDFYATEHAVVVEQFAGTDVYWCGYFLDALNLNRYATATAQPGLAVAKVNQVPIPLPPIAEQKRIVAKIEELLPLIDRYEKAWSTLEDFNRRFPVDMQKSVLQMAIQGKLVDQRPEEGTGEELLEKILAAKNAKGAKRNLTRSRGACGETHTSALSASPRETITDDEKPFDIPECWVWVRLSDLMTTISTGPFGSMLHKSDYIENGIPLVNPANIVRGRIIPSPKMMVSVETRERLAGYILHEGMIVMGRRGEMGRCAVVSGKEDGWLCGTGSFFLEPNKNIFVEYISRFFSTPYAKLYLGGESVGTTMSNLNHTILRNMPIPLPPLAEQKRIVAKLEEILLLCERLKRSS